MRKNQKIRLIAPIDYGNVATFKPFANEVIVGGRQRHGNKIPSILTANDIILFEGGTDISPSLYGEKPSWRCQFPNKYRDYEEVELFKRGLVAGCSFIGICRGAQLITALLGGKLIQHVYNHESAHVMTINQIPEIAGFSAGQKIVTSSLHHQMMNPFVLPKSEYQILAECPKDFAKAYLGEKADPIELPKDFVEPEIVWYPKAKALCIQGHPEYTEPDTAFYQLCVELARRLIVNA